MPEPPEGFAGSIRPTRRYAIEPSLKGSFLCSRTWRQEWSLATLQSEIRFTCGQAPSCRLRGLGFLRLNVVRRKNVKQLRQALAQALELDDGKGRSRGISLCDAGRQVGRMMVNLLEH